MHKFKKISGFILTMSLLAMTACGASTNNTVINDPNAADQMSSSDENNVELYVFRFDDKCIEMDNFYEIDVPLSKFPKEGGFYRIEADLSYLQGGIAGYVNMPCIKKINKCEEVSDSEVPSSSIYKDKFGLLSMDYYTDADYMLVARNNIGVYKDGEWIYKYKSHLRIGDTLIYCVENFTEDSIIDSVIYNENYFIMPEIDIED